MTDWKQLFTVSRTLHGCVDWNISFKESIWIFSPSHPTRVRGLKSFTIFIYKYLYCRTLHGCVDWNHWGGYWKCLSDTVAPYTGAWIEIAFLQQRFSNPSVAPYTGAWIEIFFLVQSLKMATSHPTRVRGLKFPFLKTPFLFYCRTLHGCVDWNVVFI